MGDLALIGFTDRHNGDIKIERHTSQRMIRVDTHLIALDRLDEHLFYLTARPLGLEGHAGLDPVDALERRSRNILDQLGVDLSETLLRGNRDLATLSDCFTRQGLLEGWQQALGTMQIIQRLAGL